jgi:hypothetical protein
VIRITDSIWVGTSRDDYDLDTEESGITAALNVAQDLRGMNGWPDVEYMQVGLIDGPGNEISDYCAAVLCLKVLIRRHDGIMVFDHNGCRALVVVLMYLNLIGGQRRPEPTGWSHWPTWEERAAEVNTKIPRPHAAHIEMFNKMPWGLIEVI